MLAQKLKKEQDDIIKGLQNEITLARDERKMTFKMLDRQQQYSRRNCLLVHGVKENKKENTDDIVTNVFSKELSENVSQSDIDRSHRLGPFNPTSKRPRSIIVKFSRYNCRRNIFMKKKLLKGKRVITTESLTETRIKYLNEAREKFGFTNVWSIDGKIVYKDASDNNKKKVYYD